MIDKIDWNPKQKKGLSILSDNKKKYILFYGGSRSGKTYLAIRAIRVRCHKYPGSKHLVSRYSFANAKKTIWMQTMLPEFKKDAVRGMCKINISAGIITYANGSVVTLGGLEPSSIDSVLAAEYGTIFITEANENRFEIIENLFSRLNDTSTDGKGNKISLKFICDLNPTVDRNWTNVLFRRGLDPISREPKINFNEYANLHFRPDDNEKNLADGYIESLKALSPAKKKRFYDGEYGSYDGLVFQLNESEHIVDDFKIPDHWKRIRAIDFGYTHPFVCLWLAYDAANDRAFVYREYVSTQQTVRIHAGQIKVFTGNEKIHCTVADHDAEDRATLSENGITTKTAKKSVLSGIDHVIDLLHFDENKKTRVKIFRSCSKLVDGIYSYRWKDSSRTKAKDREVVKEDDDECDALRYALMEMFPIVKMSMPNIGRL